MQTRWKKNGIYDFAIASAQSDRFSMNEQRYGSDMQKVKKSSEDPTHFPAFCLFNSKYRDSFNKYLKPSP